MATLGDQHIALLSLVLLLALMPTNTAFGEKRIQDTYNVQHQAPTVIERAEPVTLSFDIPAINVNNVLEAFLFYKYDGEISYRQQRASYDQTGFATTLKIDNQSAGSLEYYFVVQMNDGTRITYPATQPDSDPIRVDIVDRRETVTENAPGIDYTILSPEPGSTLPPNDVLVAITLFYEEGAVDTANSSFILTLDNQDITEQAEASDYFFSYSPDEIAPGQHRVSLELATTSDTTSIADWQFRVLDPNITVSRGSNVELSGGQEETFAPQGQVELTAQNQQVGGIGNDVLKGDIRLSGGKDNIRYSAYGLLTSQESSRLQPQNRYGGELYIGNWLEFQAGHVYPSISPLTISGRRVQGINTELHAFNGAINAQFLHGKINRRISNLYRPVTIDSVFSDNGVLIDTNYSIGFENNGRGTYKRNVTGGRLSFGRGETFQWGLNFLKVRDDTTSLATVRDFDDLMNKRPDLTEELDQSSMNDLQSNPDLLSVSGNPRPKDNFIGGSDLMVNLFDNMLRLRSEMAVGLLNEDISPGVLSSDQDLDIDLSEDESNQLDRWAWLIIINENMNTLPLRFNVEGNKTSVESAYFPTSILANQSELNFNISGNNFRAQYRWIGPNYVSLANSTIRRDVAGVTLSDRFQLFDDRLYVTLGYENLNDNVSNTKDATTSTQTARTNFSWFPIDQYLPRISVGFMYRNRDNAVPLYNPFVAETGNPENISVRNFSQSDTSITANPRLSNTSQFTTSITQQFELFDLSHHANLNFSYLDTKDEFFRFGDTKSSSVNFNLQSRFSEIPLNTTVGFNINSTETLGGLSDIMVTGFNVGGSLILMDNKLDLNTNLAFTKNNIESTSLQISNNATSDPSDDIYQPQTDENGDRIIEETENNLVIIRAGAQYDLATNHALMINFSYTNIANQLSSLNPPNDHRLEARYIFRF
ncbi:hypothetical protein NC796_05840 [Aliifodinibius sp. S!AR15-10]|uniref:hypothetical protein n=1 Tax=Aliifodinibius sp. S!AR15-10 TaxID=2950437 RepID=UPI002861A9D8|nr:hypothetical protein [Aliifodinibius sp. S!AR15-10]MDR8390648.1 hypothetical protein [Aliifodinibius sp. S!AR15-10]